MDRKNDFNYTDRRSKAIEQNLGRDVAVWADQHSAGWLLDLLANGRTNQRGPHAGTRVCDQAAKSMIPMILQSIPDVIDSLKPVRQALKAIQAIRSIR